jgi:hypothetical protein
MSGSYGINIGGLLGQGPIFRFTPSAEPRNLNGNTPTLFFPVDYTHIDHHVSFIIKKFRSVTRTSSLESDNQIFSQSIRQVAQRQAHITLPMPTSLVANYTMDYANPSLSPLGELLAHASSIVDAGTTARTIGSGIQEISNALSTQTAGQNVAQAMTAIQTQINSIFATVQNQGSNLASAAFVGGAAVAARNAGGLGQAVIANLTGIVANPHKVILFQGVDHRNHVFSFELSPRNYREAKTIIDIIYQIKLAMHPRYGVGSTSEAVGNLLGPLFPETAQGLAGGISSFGAASRAFFEYPDVFEIEFAQADKNGSASLSQAAAVNGQTPSPGRRRLFTIGECVLQGFSVNYHPLNFPSYVASIEDPTAPLMPSKIDITMSFKETDIVTKDQIERYNR